MRLLKRSSLPTTAVQTGGLAEHQRQVTGAYLLILGRRPDDDGLRHYAERVHRGQMLLSDVCAELASSDEALARIHRRAADVSLSPNGRPTPAGAIDVRNVLANADVDALNIKAEAYYAANRANPEHMLAKPFGSAAEAPELLACLSAVFSGLDLVPGDRVLDFAAGTCWTSLALAQLGCTVIASDVSSTALELGEELLRLHPLFGDRIPPRFLRFDGRRLDLPDAGVDRVLCFDAFHHMPNPSEILAEMSRVLRDDGTAAFSEPGPHHSLNHQSQFEMRSYGVVENDIVIRDIIEMAAAAGFRRVEVGVAAAPPMWLSADSFERYMAGEMSEDVAAHVRRSLDNRRIFLLHKSTMPRSRDSRTPGGLAARLELSDVRITPADGGWEMSGACVAVNTGSNLWLASDAPYGPVRLGMRMGPADGSGVFRDVGRASLPGQGGVRSGDSVTVPFHVTVSAEQLAELGGRAVLQLNLVSDGVCWFDLAGSDAARITVPPA